jgi:hypothetical protein
MEPIIEITAEEGPEPIAPLVREGIAQEFEHTFTINHPIGGRLARGLEDHPAVIRARTQGTEKDSQK